MLVNDDQNQDIEENIGSIRPPNRSSATGSFINCSTVNAKYETSRTSMFLPSAKCSLLIMYRSNSCQNYRRESYIEATFTEKNST